MFAKIKAVNFGKYLPKIAEIFNLLMTALVVDPSQQRFSDWQYVK